MALPRDLASGSAAAANASRLSLASDAPSRDSTDYSAANTTRNGIALPPELLQKSAAAQARYPIHAVLADPKGSSSLLPTMPALPSASSYLPSQLSSLSTTFTSAGTLPRSATPAGKSVAQRRAQAPPIQVSELRKVPKTDFDAYLSEIREEYDRWQHEARLAAAEAEGAAAAQSGPATSRGSSRDEVLPPLDDIPRIFFDSTFNLSNPRTFDLVTERIQLTPNASPNLSKLSAAFDAPTTRTDSGRNSFDHVPGLGPETLQDLAADQVLQDKLSHYTAVIESHLVREIGLRSSSFFAALSNLQALHQQGQDALGKIAELQGSLGTERGGVGSTAKHGLQILQAQARRRGLERIEESVRAVDEIWTAVEGVKELVENGEWDGALEVSEQIEVAYYASSSTATASSPSSRTVNGEHRPSLSHAASSSGSLATTGSHRRPTPRRAVNLTKLRALASLPSKLALLRAQIAKSLEGELVTVLEHELDTGIDEHIKLAKSGRRWKGKEREKEPLASQGQSSLAVVREDEVEEEEEDDAAPETRARERITDRVRPVVRALVRADGMDSAITAWRESVLREIRASVREHLPTAGTPGVEDDDSFAQAAIRSVSKQSVDLGSISEKSLSLAKKLRALSHAEFVALAQETYLGLLACIELVNLQAQVLVAEWQTNRREEAERRQRRRGAPAETTPSPNPIPSSSHLAVPSGPESSPSPSEPTNSFETRSTSSEDANTLATEITDVVHAVAELANVRFSKVIGVRTEVHAQLALAEFVQIFDLSWDFVVQCERICQRMIVGLRGAMVAQAKTFLQAFHQRQITENARVVEEEQWAAVEVAPNVQASVACIIQIATSDPPELLLGSRSPASSASSTASESIPPDTESAEDSSAKKTVAGPAKQIDIEGKQFFAVSAGLTTIVALMEYLKVLVNAPMLTTDVMSKIIEFMKVFNSRTCQVVLGAGAMRSAGLKNITAKHLALASQALSIMVSLIPYIREGVRRHLNPKQAVMLTEFDKLRRDYQEHQHEIHAKLIAIMSDRLHVHSRTLETINWEEPAPQPSAPNAYMEALVKEHTTLHKVLSRFLQPETVQHIMTQVFAALDAKLADLYGKVELKSPGAQDRMLVDVRYLASKLGGLKSLEDNGPGKTLETLVQSKDIPRPRTPAPAKPPSPAKVATPARSSSMQPPESPVASAEPPDQARDGPAAEKLATSQSQTASPRTSTDPASEADSSRRGAEPSSQNSFDVTGGDSTLSTPDTPLTASSAASTASSSPTIPATTSQKRKTLAERLVERMSRKAVAHTAGPATPANSAAASTAERELQEIKSSSPSEPSEKQADDASRSPDLPAPQEILQEGLDTPTLEKTLALDVEADAPLPTPTLEELDAAEREISTNQSAQPPSDPNPASSMASNNSEDVSEPIEATSSTDSPAPADAGMEVETSAADESASRAVDEPALESGDGAPMAVANDAPLSNDGVPPVADDSASPPTEESQEGGDRQQEEAIVSENTPGADDTTFERPQSPALRAEEMPAEEGDSTSAVTAESATIPQIQITSAVEDKVAGEVEISEHAAPDESAESTEAPALSSQPAVSAVASPDPPTTTDLPYSSVPTVDGDRNESVSPEGAPTVENGADVMASPETPPTAPSPAPEPSDPPAEAEPVARRDSPTRAASAEPVTVSELPEPVPPIPIVTSPPASVVTSPPPPTSPPATTSPATSPPPVDGARRKTLKERLAEAARARTSSSTSSFDDAKPSSVTASNRATSKPDGHSDSGKSPTPVSETAAVARSSSESPARPAVTVSATPDESSAGTGDPKSTETSTGNKE